MTQTIGLQRTDEGIRVSVSELPGDWSEGDTEAEAMKTIRDAISEDLAARDELMPRSDDQA